MKKFYDVLFLLIMMAVPFLLTMMFCEAIIEGRF